MDKLIHYVNLDGRINAFYSTPTIFADTLAATNYSWSVKVRHFAWWMVTGWGGVVCVGCSCSFPPLGGDGGPMLGDVHMWLWLWLCPPCACACASRRTTSFPTPTTRTGIGPVRDFFMTWTSSCVLDLHAFLRLCPAHPALTGAACWSTPPLLSAGYFTSRPALKRYVRSSSGYYQVAKQLNALTMGSPTALARFADAMGIAQHHDAGAWLCVFVVRPHLVVHPAVCMCACVLVHITAGVCFWARTAMPLDSACADARCVWWRALV